VVACGSVPVDLAAVGLAGAKVLLASSDNAVVDAAVQPDSAAWVATGP
jgi:hypothetical protein